MEEELKKAIHDVCKEWAKFKLSLKKEEEPLDDAVIRLERLTR